MRCVQRSSQVPLESKTLDAAIFCLSLMGTDWPSFLREAKRVLRLQSVCDGKKAGRQAEEPLVV